MTFSQYFSLFLLIASAGLLGFWLRIRRTATDKALVNASILLALAMIINAAQEVIGIRNEALLIAGDMFAFALIGASGVMSFRAMRRLKKMSNIDRV